MKVIHKTNPFSLKIILKSIFWFFIGVFLGLFLLISFIFIIFQELYKNTVYPGVTIDSVNFGGKSQNQVANYFSQKNDKVKTLVFIFKYDQDVATVSAKDLDFGYDEDLLAKQAFSVGRSQNIISNLSLITQAYLSGIILTPSYHYSMSKLSDHLSSIAQILKKDPVEALFSFENGKVITFKPSDDGQAMDIDKINAQITTLMPILMHSEIQKQIIIPIPIKSIKPKITTDKANNLGIEELIGTGTSLFQHSIDTRIYNITLAANRLNGILVPPNDDFSFDEALGDVTAFTGYKQAYIIQNGRTVLGDGGGVCQVSTTFFRAILNAGLPVLERHAHAYRVGYYEQDGGPGIDATIYSPSIDLKFKNDTGNYILIQSVLDPIEERLTFYLYGKKDGREVKISDPVITSQSQPPEPLYQDDPTLPKGTVKQVDFSAYGANVYFTREVKKNGKVIISERYDSNYKAWQAVYLRGTKE